ncbi:MAG: PQQ-dependent sugar dehydrogenase, partial [Actinomycetes bacterium]|nr:PQQ-dependent sugar dehydrogenase [Actinomycetes bacterium]
GEGGLLGATLSPDEGHVYLYVSTAVDNRVVRHALARDVLGPGEDILTGIPVATYHDGGQVRFGPDGMLYVSTGDAGDTMAAQDGDSLAGKILRLAPDGAPAPGNPSGTEVWSLGHRNVQGLAWDADGRLWASEFGQNSQDELNLIEPGLNYGWPLVEGEGDMDGMTPPVLVWPTSEASPSGLAFWRGSLWMAALRGERLWEIPVTDQDTGQLEPIAHWVGEFGRLRAVASAGDDAPLLVATSNTDGRGNVRAGDDRVMRVG